MEVKIPGSDLEMAKHGNAERTRLDFIGVVKDSKGEVAGGGNVRDYVDLELKGDKAAEITKHPVAYDTGFTLKPGAYSLKFLVRENETGKIGTLRNQVRDPQPDYRSADTSHEFGNSEQSDPADDGGSLLGGERTRSSWRTIRWCRTKRSSSPA